MSLRFLRYRLFSIGFRESFLAHLQQRWVPHEGSKGENLECFSAWRLPVVLYSGESSTHTCPLGMSKGILLFCPRLS